MLYSSSRRSECQTQEQEDDEDEGGLGRQLGRLYRTERIGSSHVRADSGLDVIIINCKTFTSKDGMDCLREI
jgi:hypothetical protein